MSIATSTALLTDSPQLTFTTTTPAASFPTITYPLETWMGNLTWSPPASCSAITEAKTYIWRSSGTFATQYCNNITDWETTTRHCRPGNRAPSMAEYWYPGQCPTAWTSYPTATTVMAALTTGSTTTSTGVEFTDALCCPESYTGYLLGSRHFCSRYLNATSTYYDIITWILDGNMVNGVLTSKSSRTTQNLAKETLSTDTVLTFWPVFVRYPNADARFTPTKTAPGVLQTPNSSPTSLGGSSYKMGDKKSLILGLSIPVGIFFVGFVAWWLWYCRYSKRRKQRVEKVKADRQREADLQKEEVMMSGAHKPELMGSVYVGPQFRTSSTSAAKPELDGKTKEGGDGRGVITSLEELKYDEIKVKDTNLELDDRIGRRSVARTELDHQSRRRDVADTELDGSEQERRAAELDAARTQRQMIARKQVPVREPSLGSQVSPQQQHPSGLDAYPHSPVLSGPMPDFMTLYPSADDPDAEEEERKLEYQEQRLRERREQLAREEEALRQKRVQRGSGM